MSAGILAFISMLTTVIVVGLIVRFHAGSTGVISAAGTATKGVIYELENPGRGLSNITS
jgi:succinyl-CoA synthetase alpha subunit